MSDLIDRTALLAQLDQTEGNLSVNPDVSDSFLLGYRLALGWVKDALTVPDLLPTLILADAAMNHMGDVLNNMDAVLPEDIEATADAFEAVSTAIAVRAAS